MTTTPAVLTPTDAAATMAGILDEHPAVAREVRQTRHTRARP